MEKVCLTLTNVSYLGDFERPDFVPSSPVACKLDTWLVIVM